MERDRPAAPVGRSGRNVVGVDALHGTGGEARVMGDGRKTPFVFDAREELVVYKCAEGRRLTPERRGCQAPNVRLGTAKAKGVPVKANEPERLRERQ